MRTQELDNELRSLLDLLAPDEKIREKYYDPVYKA